jgi:microcystin-dependent protein
MARVLVSKAGVIGEVKTFAGAAAPEGYLLCQGQAVSRTTYANLFDVLGTSHGQGDGSTTFNLPDYRGRFLRGRASGSANDPDRASRTAMATGGATGDSIGSVQVDSFQNITGSVVTTYAVVRSGQTGALAASTFSGGTAITSPSFPASASSGSIDFNASSSPGARTSTETRAKNAYVNYIIKY